MFFPAMTAAPATTRHKLFSPARVSAIASNTLLELIRLKQVRCVQDEAFSEIELRRV